MSLVELFLIAVALSMDAFAVAISVGLTMKKAALSVMLIVGLYFGIFQGVMPLIGYFAAKFFADQIIAYDHWIAFILLCFLGGKMIFEAIKKESGADRGSDPDAGNEHIEASLKPKKMLPLALATSIDALAVGVSFAFLRVSIAPAVLFIGVTTFLISMLGVKIGNIFGIKFRSKAEIAGGLILILIGLKILLEHLAIISF